MPGPKKNKRKPKQARPASVSHHHVVRKNAELVRKHNVLAEKLVAANRYLISAHAELTMLREALLETIEAEEVTVETVRDTVDVLDRLLDPLDVSMGETPRERLEPSPAAEVDEKRCVHSRTEEGCPRCEQRVAQAKQRADDGMRCAAEQQHG